MFGLRKLFREATRTLREARKALRHWRKGSPPKPATSAGADKSDKDLSDIEKWAKGMEPTVRGYEELDREFPHPSREQRPPAATPAAAIPVPVEDKAAAPAPVVKRERVRVLAVSEEWQQRHPFVRGALHREGTLVYHDEKASHLEFAGVFGFVSLDGLKLETLPPNGPAPPLSIDRNDQP
jgi:hypothetical protein